MSNYELMTIYKIDLDEKGAKELSSEIQKIITSLGGKINESDFWGKRKFAYEMENAREGYYEVFKIEMDPSKVDTLKKKFNLVNSLVRYLITAQS